MSMSSRLKAVIACKGFSTKYIYDYIYLSNYIWAPENGGNVYKNVVIPKHFVIFVQPFKLKLNVCTTISSWLFYFNSILVAYRAKIMKIVSVSKYIWT